MPNYTILLIDYDPRGIERLRAPLERVGFRVEVATDGPAGIKRFHQLRPDLTLIEAMLPKKHGFDVCRELKSSIHGQNSAVFIVTSVYRGRKYRSEARHLHGCDEYLVRPISDEDLLAAVSRHVSLPDPSRSVDGGGEATEALDPEDAVLSIEAVDDEVPGAGFEVADPDPVEGTSLPPTTPTAGTIDREISDFNLVRLSPGLGADDSTPDPLSSRVVPRMRAGGPAIATARSRPRPARRPRPKPAPPPPQRATSHDQRMVLLAVVLLGLLGLMLAYIVFR
ncbi:MAG TPA: response regulator [Candidatus Polarisedimenticolaceae bacterium]|nr:response regulator [Candidatus Polarisedimenticolaceae bacterium]